MGNVIDAIIDKIRRNRISTTEVADCMNKTGLLEGLRSLNKGHHRVGKVFWTYTYNNSNWGFHEQIQESPENAVVLCETFNCGNRAAFGALVTKFLVLYRQASAVVCDGYVRDAPHILKEKWPVWAKGVTPIGCLNRSNPEPLDPQMVAARMEFYRHSLAVCDDSGVVIIPEGYINETFLETLDFIENQEDIWFDCIDRLKWTTFDTVCLKKYKNDPDS